MGMATWWFGDDTAGFGNFGTVTYGGVISTAALGLAPKKVPFPPRPRLFPPARAPPPLREQGRHQGKKHAVEVRG
jgi:hypothetical protein